MALSGGLAAVMVARKLAAHLRDRTAGSAGLERSLRRAAGLRRGELRRLRSLAGRVEATHAATLLACPSLLVKLRDLTAGRDRLMVERLLSRLAA